MKCSKLIDFGATSMETQSHLVDFERVIVTSGFPCTMRGAVKGYAAVNSVTFMSLAKQCLIEKLSKKA